MSGFKIEKVNDIELTVLAENYPKLFNTLIKAFNELTVKPQGIKGSREIKLNSFSIDMLAVDFFNELIYLFETQKIIPVKVDLNVDKVNDEFLLNGVLYYDSSKYLNSKHVLKSATFHDLKLEKHDAILKLYMIIDI